MLQSGIDLHKRMVLSTIDAEGQCVAEAELPTTRAAVQAYFAAQPGSHRAVVESTATWYWLRDLLVPLGVDLRLGHSKYIKAISYAKVKTDAVDAHTLAQLLRNDLIPEGHMISAEHREERDLLRARLRLVAQQVRCRLTVEGLLAQYNVTSVGSLPELVQWRVEMLAQHRTLVSAHIKQIEQALVPRLVPTPDAERLLYIPGIGKIVAFTVLLEIGDIARFPTVNGFFSYCRLVPVPGTPAGRCASSGRRMATSISRSRFTTRRCARSSTSRRSSASIEARRGGNPRRSRGRWSPRNSRGPCTSSSLARRPSMARSRASP